MSRNFYLFRKNTSTWLKMASSCGMCICVCVCVESVYIVSDQVIIGGCGLGQADNTPPLHLLLYWSPGTARQHVGVARSDE